MVRRIKIDHGCAVCGEDHPACLQFHHREPATKVERINRLVLRKQSVAQLLMEIEKCDVLCANCHAKKHWIETHPETEQ